jgi:hypothetical protein
MTAAASAQDRQAVDWGKVEPEILSTFTTLLKIDISNPAISSAESRRSAAVKPRPATGQFP